MRRGFYKVGLCPVLGWDVAETDIYRQRPSVIDGTEMSAIETGKVTSALPLQALVRA